MIHTISMEIRHFTVGPFQEHTYVLSDPISQEAFVIDPGGWSQATLTYVAEQKLQVKAIISTHGHIDHIAGAYELREKLKVPYWLHEKDLYLLENLDLICSYFGFPKIERPVVDGHIKEGQILMVGDHEIKIIGTPGHTPGGLCFLTEKEIFVGDTLFQGSIGRTDLPGGNYKQLLASIQNKLLILSDDIKVYCGHGPTTTIGDEKLSNPFLTGEAAEFF